MSCAPKASKMVEYYKKIIADEESRVDTIKSFISGDSGEWADEDHKDLDRLRKHIAICKENLEEWKIYADNRPF